jgi:hypothetical protein
VVRRTLFCKHCNFKRCISAENSQAGEAYVIIDLMSSQRITLRLAVYRKSIRLGDKPLEAHDQRFFLQLNPCGHSLYVTTSLMRRWVYDQRFFFYN